jgi:hypothetical protein
MTVREYLGQIERLDCYIQQKQQQLAELKEMVYSLQGVDTTREKVDTSCFFRQQSIDYFVRLKDEIEQKVCEFQKLKDKIITEIQQLDNLLYVNILYKRYIEFKKYWQIAEELHYSTAYIKAVSVNACKEFGKTIFVTSRKL